MAKVVSIQAQPISPLEALVRDYLASCRARGLAPSTVNQAYGYSLNVVFLPWCAAEGLSEVRQLDQRVLDRFTGALLDTVGKRGKPLAKDTVHSYVRGVRQFLAWCRKEGEAVAGQPQLPRLARRVLDVLSREEIGRLVDATPAERDQLIIRVLADTGIRGGSSAGSAPRMWSVPRTGGHSSRSRARGQRRGWCRYLPSWCARSTATSATGRRIPTANASSCPSGAPLTAGTSGSPAAGSSSSCGTPPPGPESRSGCIRTFYVTPSPRRPCARA